MKTFIIKNFVYVCLCLISVSDSFAQNQVQNPIFPECKLGTKEFNDGPHELCRTKNGTIILAIIANGKAVSYKAVDISNKTLALFKSNSSGASSKCPAGMEKNCNCIPTDCFCEPSKKQ